MSNADRYTVADFLLFWRVGEPLQLKYPFRVAFSRIFVALVRFFSKLLAMVFGMELLSFDLL
jgi:hypothetical protein